MSKRGNGEGSIYQMKDGRWRAAVSNGFKNGIAQRKVYTAATRGDVQKKLTQALRDQQLGIPLANERSTVAAFLQAWLSDIATPRVRPKTLRTYSDLIRLHIEPTLGKTPLAKLSPTMIRRLLSDKAKDGLSAGTQKHILVVLRIALGGAVKDGLIPRNVALLVDPPRAVKRDATIFSPEQAKAFIGSLAGDRLEALFTAAVALGLRQSEILGLEWGAIDLERKELTVKSSLQRVGGKLVSVEPKSKASRRTIGLPAVVASALLKHQAVQQKDREWAGEAWIETAYVFTSTIGTPLDPRNVTRRFKAAVKLAELPEIRFHDLRHSAASLLLAQGVSPSYITEMLGHSQVAFTLQTYAHVLPHVKRDVATKMDEIFGVATKVANKEEKQLMI